MIRYNISLFIIFYYIIYVLSDVDVVELQLLNNLGVLGRREGKQKTTSIGSFFTLTFSFTSPSSSLPSSWTSLTAPFVSFI